MILGQKIQKIKQAHPAFRRRASVSTMAETHALADEAYFPLPPLAEAGEVLALTSQAITQEVTGRLPDHRKVWASYNGRRGAADPSSSAVTALIRAGHRQWLIYSWNPNSTVRTNAT